MTDTATTSRPLDPVVVQSICTFHEMRCPREVRSPGKGHQTPAAPIIETYLYRVDTGRPVGTMAQPEAAAHAHRFVKLSTDKLADPDELAEVRVMADGTVVQ
jgi:hypothetical protein